MAESRILVGDCRDVLRSLPERSVQTCITSPPYFGLRDYGTDGQLGLEESPEEYVDALVSVFREVRRALRDDGTVWVNLGDSYAGGGGFSPDSPSNLAGAKQTTQRGSIKGTIRPQGRVKAKDLIGVPWLVAFALRADGWYLRSDIVWSKLNPMPESVTDRPTKAHEYVFLLSKRASYFYDADAIREGYEVAPQAPGNLKLDASRNDHDRMAEVWGHPAGRNKRSVWTVATQPFPGAHFATFPPRLVEPCVLAGSSPRACGECGASWRRVVERQNESTYAQIKREHGMTYQDMKAEAAANGITPGNVGGTHRPGRRGEDLAGPANVTVGWEPSCPHHDDTGRSMVLDPFAGSGTVGVVAGWHGRDFTGIELNPAYARMARERIALEGRPGSGGKPPTHKPTKVGEGQENLFG